MIFCFVVSLQYYFLQKNNQLFEDLVESFIDNNDDDKDEKNDKKEDADTVESPRSCVTPPPLQPPRSWDLIQAGMIDEKEVLLLSYFVIYSNCNCTLQTLMKW